MISALMPLNESKLAKDVELITEFHSKETEALKSEYTTRIKCLEEQLASKDLIIEQMHNKLVTIEDKYKEEINKLQEAYNLLYEAKGSPESFSKLNSERTYDLPLAKEIDKQDSDSKDSIDLNKIRVEVKTNKQQEDYPTIECDKCGCELLLKELDDHLLECGRQIIPLSISKEFYSKACFSPLTDWETERHKAVEYLPLQSISINQIKPITYRTKQSRNNEEVMNSVKKRKTMQTSRHASSNKFDTVRDTMFSNRLYKKKERYEDTFSIDEFEGETNMPELGEKEGAVLRPRITLRGVPHSSNRVNLKSII
jgi:hypothetical protein